MDIDQSYLGPHILTSAVVRLDKGVVAVVQRFVRGKLAADRNSVFDLRNGGVGLGRISPKVAAPLCSAAWRRIRAAIVAGKIRVRGLRPPSATYLSFSSWVPTQTAPSPTATEIGWARPDDPRFASSVGGSIRQR